MLAQRIIRRGARARRGATLLEVVISATLLLMTAGATITSIADMRGAATTATTNTRLAEQGQRAMARIIDDLRRSGFALENGKVFPHLFEEGDAAPEFDLHDHVPAQQAAVFGSPDYVAPRAIVFLQPGDADLPGTPGFGRPDVGADGELVWDAREFSYVTTTINGRNVLQRRVDGVAPTTVCSDVEWIRFDDSATPGAQIPATALRVQLALRALDGEGRVVRWRSEAVVRLRNG